MDLKQLEKEAFRDSLQDGLIDLSTGVYLLILSVILKQSLIAFIAILVIFYPAMIVKLKQRYTYPRIGYVTFKKEFLDRLVRTILTGFVIGLIALIVTLVISKDIGTAREWYKWMPILFGFAFSGIFLSLGLLSGLFRYFIYSAFSLIGGFLFPFVPVGIPDPSTGAVKSNTSFPFFYVVERLDNISFYLLFLSIFLIICGAVIFIHFLITKPILQKKNANE
jgi:hypothetical protein